MAEAGDEPIVCTLDAKALGDRSAAWRTVLQFASARRALDDGVSIEFQDVRGLADSLSRLAELEAACCAWMTMAVSRRPLTLAIHARGAAVESVHRLFDGAAPTDFTMLA